VRSTRYTCDVVAIAVEGLTKRYGSRRGIDDVSFEVPDGSLFGFIGPNGAGKTTTIRILLGLLRPHSGTARLFGVDAVEQGPRARAGIGYVPSETNLYPGMRVADILDFFGQFHRGDHAPHRRELVDMFELDTAARASELSLGNRKKVAIVAALQHRPRLAILDEASTGLDPVMQARLHELLRGEVARGATVFFSSHALAEVQALCRMVAVVREGRVLAIEDVAALRARAVRRVRVSFAAAPPELPAIEGVQQLVRGERTIELVFGGAPAPLLEALARATPLDVTIEEPSLDELFLRYYVKEQDRG
jgi:ABC-2 type transport system ATP-binding protein